MQLKRSSDKVFNNILTYLPVSKIKEFNLKTKDIGILILPNICLRACLFAGQCNACIFVSFFRMLNFLILH